MTAPLSIAYELALDDMLVAAGPRNVLQVFCDSIAESELRDILADLARCRTCGKTIVVGAARVVSGQDRDGDTMAFCDDACVARYEERATLDVDRW